MRPAVQEHDGLAGIGRPGVQIATARTGDVDGLQRDRGYPIVAPTLVMTHGPWFGIAVRWRDHARHGCRSAARGRP